MILLGVSCPQLVAFCDALGPFLCRTMSMLISPPHEGSPRKHRWLATSWLRMQYGEIPEEHWSYPSWVPPEKAAAARVEMAANHVLYGA